MELTPAQIAQVKSRYMTPSGDYKIYCDMPFPKDMGFGLKRMIKCGVCKKCRAMRRQQWTGRLLAEANDHSDITFATLTYDPANEQNTFHYQHIQLYLKRLRKCTQQRLRFFTVGERGDKFGRIHWHIVLFGHQPFGKERLHVPEWPYGLVQYAPATAKAMSYVASYCLKKRRKQTTYISRMSRRPGIGIQTMRKLGREMARSNIEWPKLPITVQFGPSKYPIDGNSLIAIKKEFQLYGGKLPEIIQPTIAFDIEAKLHPYWVDDAKELAHIRDTIYADNKLPG